jgi:RNA polymerase sigma factor (sigma-70 family)
LSPFHRLSVNDLDALSDEKLIAYYREAIAAGQGDAGREAMAVLAMGYASRIRFWARDVQEYADDIVQEVLEDMLKLVFEGRTPGQLGSLIRTITRRRAVDHIRRKQARPRETALPEEHEESEDIWGAAGEVPDHADEVVEHALVRQAFDELSDEHRRVVERGGDVDLGFDGLPAKEVTQAINQESGSGADSMTNANVHQILSRFRRRLREIAKATAS